MGRLAILAGSGELPRELATRCDAPLYVAFGQTPAPEGVEAVVGRVERLGELFDMMRAAGVDRLVMAGAVHRPDLGEAVLDARTAALAPELTAAMAGGDDAVLRHLIGVFEREGFAVVGAHEVAPDLVVAEGVLGANAPTEAQRRDGARARAILSALGPADVAQACVVAGGLCLGLESIYGTDALLDFVALHRDERQPARGGVLAKAAKPGQDLRADLPTVGPATIAAMARARLDGLLLQADRVLVIERDATLAAADAAGMAVWAER